MDKCTVDPPLGIKGTNGTACRRLVKSKAHPRVDVSCVSAQQQPWLSAGNQSPQKGEVADAIVNVRNRSDWWRCRARKMWGAGPDNHPGVH